MKNIPKKWLKLAIISVLSLVGLVGFLGLLKGPIGINLTNYQKQSFFEVSLQSPITSTETSTIVLSDVPDYVPSGETIYLSFLDPQNPETIAVTGWNTSTNRLTGVTRGIPKYEGAATTSYAHGGGTRVVLADDWNVFREIASALNSKSDRAGDTFTGNINFSGTTFAGLQVNTLTTAQRNALTTTTNGMIIYNSTAGEFQVYQGGAWSTVASGSTQPDASTSTAGKVELPTSAERASSTEFGGTGAPLVLTNAALRWYSSGVSDAYNVVALNASGTLDYTITGATTTPTAFYLPAASASGTINAGWVPSSGNSFLTTGEAINGSATPQLVSVSTTGLLYAADADDVTRRKVYGFITTNAAVTTTPLVITDGLVTGFSGLTIGAQYYASTTAGAITTSPTPSTTIPIGYAVSASVLRVDFGVKRTQIVPTLLSAAGTTQQIFHVGFRPEVIEITGAMSVGASAGNQAKVYGRFLGTTLVNSTRVVNDTTMVYGDFSTNSALEVTAGSMTISVSTTTDNGFTLNYAGSSMTTQNMSILVSGN